MKEFLYQVLVQLPEPVYFSLFLIIGKNIKEKRLLLTGIMIMQYLLLMHIFPYNIWFQLIYTFMSFVNLKVLYKYATIKNYVIALIINRTLMFTVLYFSRNKIKTIYKSFCSLWNRHNNPKKMRSLTLRNSSIIIFNLTFAIINSCIALAAFLQ